MIRGQITGGDGTVNFLRRVMAGRYGLDQLGLFNMFLYFVLYLVSLFTGWLVFYVLSVLFVALFLFRSLSRNLPRRQRENAAFLKLTAPVRNWWRTQRMIRTDKAHRYFKCPNCGQHLRVPRGNGKIRVTCRACGTSFEKKS